MTERKQSADSFDAFFNSNEEKKETTTALPSQSSTIAALIKSQPVLHHRRQTPSERETTIPSQKTSRLSSPPIDDETKKVETPKKPIATIVKPPPAMMKKPTSQPIPRKKERFLPYIRPKKKRSQASMPRHRPQPVRGEIEQRIFSAQQNKLNELQSCLAELSRQLDEEREETRMLRLIKKREDNALKKFEDQEYDVHRVARDYTRDIDQIKENLTEERQVRLKHQKQIEQHDEQLREQTKRIRRYEKLINDPDLDDLDQLKDQLKESTKKLQHYEEKIAKKEKQIASLEKEYRDEIQDELVKQSELKRQLNKQIRANEDLVYKLEEKNKQVGTMHIYIQRGGRRPSNASVYLSKSRSLQSLYEPSPRFSEKVLEYDKKRRELEKLKPKPQPKPLPAIARTQSLPRTEQKYFAPAVEKQAKTIITTTRKIPPEKLHPLVTPKSIEEEKSIFDDDTTLYQSTVARTPSRSPSPTIMERNENHITQARIHRRPSSPILPPVEPRLVHSGREVRRTPAHLSKPLEPILPSTSRSHGKRDLANDWPDFFDVERQGDSSNDDLLSKLISHEPKEKTIAPSSPPPRPDMIMFEPSTAATSKVQAKKPPTRITTTSIFDSDQTSVNSHNGKSTNSVDPFDSIFKAPPKGHTHNRDDTFTVSETKIEPFDSLFGSTTTKSNASRGFSMNDKIQRPKVVTNTSKVIPNRALVDEIEEFVL